MVFAAHNPKRVPSQKLAINQQLLDAELAEPWALSVHTPYWSNQHDPEPQAPLGLQKGICSVRISKIGFDWSLSTEM